MSATSWVREHRTLAIAVTVAFLGLVGGGVWWRCCAPDRGGPLSALVPEVRAPDGVRIRVEILNATTTPRLALTATRVLRDRGFDVVAIGNHTVRRDSTLIVDRVGQPGWARLVSGALRVGTVETRRDTSRYVDVSVLLGADWTPPAKTFHP